MKYLFILLTLNLYCQPLKYSQKYAINNCNSPSIELFRYDNKYYVLGISANTVTNQYNGLTLLVTDTLGVEIEQKQFYHPLGYLFKSNAAPHIFNQLNEKNAIFSGFIVLNLDHWRGTLVKLDLQTRDTSWVKTYTQPGDSSEFLSSTSLADSSIIVFGYKYYQLNNNHYSKSFMMKVDKNGNYQWHKYIGLWTTNCLLNYQKIIKINDNDFVVGGTKYFTACNPQAFMVRIDTNANYQYQAVVVGINYSALLDMIPLQDGSFLIGGSFKSLNNCNSLDKSRRYLYRFNPATGSMINFRKYNRQAGINSFLRLIQSANGVIYAAGGTGDPGNMYSATVDILQTNYNLDSLRLINLEYSTINDQKAIWSLLPTSDKGFVGTIYCEPPAGQQQKNWIIKADSNGCYSPILPTVTVNSGTICSGNSFTLFPSGANTFSYTGGLAVVSPTINSTYSVMGAYSNGCVSLLPAIANVTVLNLPLPILNAISSNSIICAGEGVTFSVTGAFTYKWPTLFETDSVVIVYPNITANYPVTGTDKKGCYSTFTLTQLVDPCVGINELKNMDEQLIIYPNPTKGKLFFEQQNSEEINIINSLGQSVYYLKNPLAKQEIDLSSFPSGIYFLKIQYNSAQKVLKIIKE